MDRSRRATNPDNFDRRGRAKKGVRKWNRSRRYQRLAEKRRERERRLAAERKRAHGETRQPHRRSGQRRQDGEDLLRRLPEVVWPVGQGPRPGRPGGRPPAEDGRYGRRPGGVPDPHDQVESTITRPVPTRRSLSPSGSMCSGMDRAWCSALQRLSWRASLKQARSMLAAPQRRSGMRNRCCYGRRRESSTNLRVGWVPPTPTRSGASEPVARQEKRRRRSRNGEGFGEQRTS